MHVQRIYKGLNYVYKIKLNKYYDNKSMKYKDLNKHNVYTPYNIIYTYFVHNIVYTNDLNLFST